VASLRERKKLETRRHIADTARRLFAERSFDAVTVDEVARAADVSKKTVFNYFPTKEDLVFDRMQDREALLVGLVRERAPGVSLAEAFRSHGHEFMRHLAEKPAGFHRGGLLDTIRSSPALERRLHAMQAHQVEVVAGELRAITGAAESDPVPMAVAHTLIGAHRTLFLECHRRLAAGESPADVATALEPYVDRIYDLLEHGLAGYARTETATPDRPDPGRRLTDQLTEALAGHAG
jgi:AcrR family transcriptional regulator